MLLAVLLALDAERILPTMLRSEARRLGLVDSVDGDSSLLSEMDAEADRGDRRPLDVVGLEFGSEPDLRLELERRFQSGDNLSIGEVGASVDMTISDM